MMTTDMQENAGDSSEKILYKESFWSETKAIIDGWWRVTGDFLVDVVVAETEVEAGEMFLQLHRLAKETVLQIVPMDCLPQAGTDAIFYPGDMTADNKKLLLKSAVQSIPDWAFRRNQVKA
jgi:hypothetical protein